MVEAKWGRGGDGERGAMCFLRGIKSPLHSRILNFNIFSVCQPDKFVLINLYLKKVM